ncbi:diguanylate cyclase/phosphodiesterase [Komagataeibacter europaeus NBRC 3261]|uniref:Diguanylate cyclase/phosphodiesterase n=1 Tax=Komagataeibacter europaeus NBRC 3261 TaxID=1234669 RepID=A0A0D6Q1J1_KOMEU|nr:EAL domain-containing protein [Komagataeibacter europaeus]GAN96835.1 diguanylate cyclase/phosphodiesterase [Komagataeibacter europaeus NBRC 3261]
MLDQACQVAAGWDGNIRVAVNMSASQFLLPRFADTVQAALARSGLPADRLVIEITEATIQRDRPRALAMARKVHALGVRLALDEFGGPKSVLSMLREFPFDKIKIDRTLMQQVGTDPVMTELVRSVMIMGHALRVSVLAQGIETPGQLALLSSEGCDEGQGYLLGRPAHVPMAAHAPAPGAPTMPQTFAVTPMRAACAPSFNPAA